ncbi:hypothetical protein D9756_003940 [Leucocoprinus leucothites]|uniref:Uncharacterized protein n=1 Tax=Leucocoprinus leucothites TaxID=201217 RepID=A0A8H5G087_9AGAR|nr:hypothetical protein D9756_003940 [Leucoagaricus leucothites]
MAFSVAALGLLMCFRFLFLLSFPRVAGSMRLKRQSASDLIPRSQFEYTRSDNPPFDFLASRVPGLFLGLEIPGDVSLLKVYGHRLAGASLYGVCVDCNGDYGSYWTADGHSASFESTPSCLFSLSLEKYSKTHSVELHNSYDHRFSTHGTVTISSVEYISQEQRYPEAITTAGLCEVHFNWPERLAIMPRQEDTRPSNTSQPAASDAGQPRGHLGGKMDVMIGLVATLITIVVIILIFAGCYMLRLRNKDRLRRRPERDPESEEVDYKGKSPFASGKTGSQTLAEISTQDKQLMGKDRLAAEGYLKDPRAPSIAAERTTSSFSTGTAADVTKPGPGNTETGANAPTRPRLHGTQPLTSPPSEPIPALPESPPMPSRTPIYEIYGQSSLASSPVQSQERKLGYPRSRANPVEDSQRPQGTNYNEVALGSNTLRHLRNGSSSDNSTSYEIRSVRRPRPPSKQLPPPPSGPSEPFSEEFAIESPTRTGHSANRGKTADRSAWSNSKRQTSNRLTLAPIPIPPIRESSLASRVDAASSPHQIRGPPKTPSEHTRSAEDLRRRARSQVPGLRVTKSSPELEQPHPSQDIRLGASTISSQRQGYDRPNQTRRANHQPRRESRRASRLKLQRLNLEFTGPDLDDLFTSSHEVSRPPGAVEGNASVEIARATRIQVGSHRIMPGNDTAQIDNRKNANSRTLPRDPRPPLPQPPSYEQTTAQVSTPPTAVIAPGRGKRALPKPPT